MKQVDLVLSIAFVAVAVVVAFMGVGPFGSRPSWAIVVLGLVLIASCLLTITVALRTKPRPPTTWILVGRNISLGLMGVGLVLAPFARFVGAAVGLLGAIGRFYFLSFASLVRREKRRAR